MQRSLALLPVLALLLAGCSSTTEPKPTKEQATVESVAPAEAKDVTADVRDAAGTAGDAITKAEETEPGRISVETSLVDPRGEDGSAEAKQAIEICEAAAGLDGVTYVSVLEEDGTSWILYGHPMAEDGECTEV